MVERILWIGVDFDGTWWSHGAGQFVAGAGFGCDRRGVSLTHKSRAIYRRSSPREHRMQCWLVLAVHRTQTAA